MAIVSAQTGQPMAENVYGTQAFTSLSAVAATGPGHYVCWGAFFVPETWCGGPGHAAHISRIVSCSATRPR